MSDAIGAIENILKGGKSTFLGMTIGVLGFVVIDTKLIHPMLEKNRQLYKNLFENANDAIYLIDLDKQIIIDANEFCETLMGYSRQELRKMSIHKLIPEEEFGLYANMFQELRYKDRVHNITGIHQIKRDGTTIDINLSASIINVAGKRIIQAIVRDITDQRLAEERQHRYLRDLETLSAIAQEISAKLEIEDLLPKIAEHAVNLADGHAGGVGLLDNETLKYVYLHNLPGLPDKISLDTNTDVLGDVIRNRQTLILDDYPSHPKAFKGFIDSNVKTAIMVPIVSGDEVRAVIKVFGFSYEKKFDAYNRSLLESVAKQASIAIENAMLHEQVNEALQISNLLLEISGFIGTTLDINEILERLVSIGAESTGLDRSYTGLYSPERDEIDIVASIDKKQIGLKLRQPEAGSEITEVLHGRQVISYVDDPLISPRQRDLMLTMDIKSCLCNPLTFAGKVIGFMVFGSTGKHEFDSRQIKIARGVANQAAMALQNAILYTQTKTALEKEHYIAEELQRSLLPTKFPEIPHTDIGAYYLSATGTARVGGDFYDIVRLSGNKYAFMIGDVSGKGIEAAASTAMAKYIIRAFIFQSVSPASALSQANSAIGRQIEKGVFVTVFCAVYDATTGEITYANAGHPHPCYLDSEKGVCSHLPSFDPAIGILANYSFRENSVILSPGSYVVTFTDGTFEARKDSEFFGEARLMKVIEESSGGSAQHMADEIVNECFRFSEGNLGDDLAVLVVKRLQHRAL